MVSSSQSGHSDSRYLVTTNTRDNTESSRQQLEAVLNGGVVESVIGRQESYYKLLLFQHSIKVVLRDVDEILKDPEYVNMIITKITKRQ